MEFTIEDIKNQTREVLDELLRNCSEGYYKLNPADIIVIGCSTSKVMGYHMGSHSTEDVAKAIMGGLSSIINE